MRIVEILSKNKYGMTRGELAKKAGLHPNGNFSGILQNLIDSGFVMKTVYFSKRKEFVYQLGDFYTLFYFEFIKEHYGEGHYWSNSVDLSKRRAYFGLAYELLCKKHLRQIKNALGISGINATSYSRLFGDDEDDKGGQIDLLIDQRDNVADIFEIKFSTNEFEINKEYHRNLLNKIERFQEANAKKSIVLVLITTCGLKDNLYFSFVNKAITIGELFS